MKSKIGLVLLLFAFVSACKKKTKEDTEAPCIGIDMPSVGTSYNMFDTIHIAASFSDNIQLSKIEISLRDLNGSLVQAGGSLALGGTTYRYETDYILSEYRLKTGDYNLEFVLSDGTNVTVKNIRIHIIESPTYLTGYYFVYGNNTSHSLNKLDSSFTNISGINTPGTYGSSGISLYYQQLYHLNPSTQTLKTYKISNHALNWSLSNIGINNSVCVVEENKVYVSKASGNVVSYNHDGTIIRTYFCNETNFYVKHIFPCGNYLVVNIVDNVNSASKKTVVFEVSTGIVKHVITDNTECVQAFSRNADEIYLIIKTNTGSSIIGKLNMTTLNYYQPLNFASPVMAAALIDSETLVYSCADGTIKQYTIATGNLITLLSGVPATKMYYNSRFNKFYIASAKALLRYNKAAFALNYETQQILADTIRDFHVVYNK